MSGPPQTTPVPLPIFMAATSPAPTRRPLDTSISTKNSSNKDKEPGKTEFTLPKLRLEIRDLSHDGSKAFLSSVNASTTLETSVRQVLKLLYLSPTSPFTSPPNTRSVTLILRSMPGVAYTTGAELDDDHKEIHFSTEYIDGIAETRKTDEIEGVLVHEMVHCFQYNGKGTCPGGLIEGIADWVRLNCHLEPPHWKREPDAQGPWDAGYQHTGYFLDYLETRYGQGTISRMNEKLRVHRYEEKPFWTELLGRPVEQLWSDYVAAVSDKKSLPDSAAASTVDDEEIVMVEKADANANEHPSSGKENDASSEPVVVATKTAASANSKTKRSDADEKVPAGVV